MKLLFQYIRTAFEIHAESIKVAAKGALGISASGTGFYVSTMPKVQAWLQILSLLVGCAVGVATLVSIIRGKKK